MGIKINVKINRFKVIKLTSGFNELQLSEWYLTHSEESVRMSSSLSYHYLPSEYSCMHARTHTLPHTLRMLAAGVNVQAWDGRASSRKTKPTQRTMLGC